MTDYENFEPPQYDPRQEHLPVDIFDIPASQKRLAEPTELRPYNGFSLLGLGLSIVGVVAAGLPFFILWLVHSPVFGLSWITALLCGAIFGIPATLACLIGIYQLSFLGFEQGKAVTWLGLVLSLALVALGVLAGWVLCYALNEEIKALQQLGVSFSQSFS